MLLKIKPLLIKQAIVGIIAPHGMTDTIHALQTNNLKALYGINAISMGSFFAMHKMNAHLLLNGLFIAFSTLHFQHDIPAKNWFLRLFTILSIFRLGFYDTNILILYMVLAHVPQHYMNNFKYLAKTPAMSFIIMGLTTLFMVNLEKFQINNGIVRPVHFDVIKGIIVAHIVYQELFIHPDLSQFLLKILMYNLNVI